MTTIEVTCDVCGDVELTPVSFSIVLRDEGEFYRFLCGECDTHTERLSNEQITAVLLGVGVRQLNLTTITEQEIKEFTRQIQRL